jgi:hypothetical protein
LITGYRLPAKVADGDASAVAVVDVKGDRWEDWAGLQGEEGYGKGSNAERDDRYEEDRRQGFGDPSLALHRVWFAQSSHICCAVSPCSHQE